MEGVHVVGGRAKGSGALPPELMQNVKLAYNELIRVYFGRFPV